VVGALEAEPAIELVLRIDLQAHRVVVDEALAQRRGDGVIALEVGEAGGTADAPARYILCNGRKLARASSPAIAVLFMRKAPQTR
jgi:hypothetical protein